MSQPQQPFNVLVHRLISLPEDERNAILQKLKANNPDGYKKLNDYFKANRGAVDEALGGEHWLKKLGALTFTRPFAPIQKRFIEWNWGALQKVQDKIPLEPRERIGFLPWPRATGKSSLVEWACIAEGCLLRSGYVIYLAAKLSQAIDHVVAIRDRIESEHVADLYPWMGKPKLGTHGNKFGWGQEFLMTSGGWAIRPVGADVAMRGGKSINIRPSLIVPDDYDELGDSPHVVEHKEHMLTRAILPMGNVNTRVLVPQNPIHANSVVNRMLTGASLALAKRTVFGEINEDGSLSNRPIPAISGLVYEVRQADEGPYTVITQGESNWDGISVEDWESVLNDVSPEAFEAEYQHNLEISLEERVLPEYDDRILRTNLISWSQFEALYKHRRVPSDWPCDVGLDVGFTVGHISAWTFLTKAPEGVPLTGSIFRYRGRTFQGIEIGDQSVAVNGALWPSEMLQREYSSHEGESERLTLNRKHGWHFQTCKFGKKDGLSQWRHYLKADKSQPHPFHRDEKQPDGLWKIGRPAWFDVVDDDQFLAPKDDKGLKTHRNQAFGWRMRKEEETKSGITVEQPMKKDEDTCFVAGTTITTRYGEIAIEQIRPNDVVLTRQGWRKVLVAGKTSLGAEIWELKLSNGSRLRGTKAHPIWVVGYGWKPLSELKAGERLLSSMERDSIATQTQSIGRTEPISSRMFMLFLKALGLYILSYGKQSMERFQKATQFTIKTIIRSTTLTPIFSYSLAQNIAATTDAICRPNSRRECERTLSASRNLQKFGIGVLKGLSGIASMPKSLFASHQKSQNHASIVGASILPVGGLVGFARTTASRTTTFVRRSWLAQNAFASVVSRYQNWQTASEKSVLRVLQCERLKQPQTVYNLSVKDCPEYFANGVLVHNCDATRMITAGAGFGPAQQPMTQAQKLAALIPQGYSMPELAARTDIDPDQKALTGYLAEFLAKKTMKGCQPPKRDLFGQSI